MKLKKIICFFIFFIIIINNLNAQWQHTNGPCGGTIKALFVNGSNIFAGTGSAGVYKSIDNGANWIAADSGITNKEAHSFAKRDSILYVGTGNCVFYSTNNGTNWVSLNNNLITDVMSNPIYSLATNDTTVFAGSLLSLYVLNNNAISWSSKSNSLSGYIITSLVVSGTNIYAGTYGGGVYLSSDNGVNWDTLNKGLPMPIGIGALAINGTDIFAGTDYGVYKFNTIDSSWINIGLSGYAIYSLAIKDTNIYAGTNNGIFLSTDYGSDWISINNGLSFLQINAIAINGTNIFVGTEHGGVFLSTNNGSSWIAANNGIRATVAYPFAKIGSYIMYSGNRFKSLYSSINNGMDWSLLNIEYDGSDIYIFAINGSTIFAGTYAGELLRSNDNGLNWIIVKHFVQDTMVNSVEISGSNVFLGTNNGGLFLSTDNGISWTSINNGLTTTTNTLSPYVAGIIDTNIFVYVNGDLFLSNNKGINLNKIYTITDNYLYSITTFGKGIIYTTSNKSLCQINYNGTNWISTCKNSNIDLSTLCINGSNFFVSNENKGIYLSTDTGTTWNPVYDGLGDTIIFSLTTNGTYLFAGTQGGVWRRPLSEMVGIKEPQFTKIEEIRVYPNPAKDRLTIEINSNKEQRIEIINPLGQCIYTSYIYDKKTIINTSAFANGVYFLKVSSDKETMVRKFVKE